MRESKRTKTSDEPLAPFRVPSSLCGMASGMTLGIRLNFMVYDLRLRVEDVTREGGGITVFWRKSSTRALKKHIDIVCEVVSPEVSLKTQEQRKSRVNPTS